MGKSEFNKQEFIDLMKDGKLDYSEVLGLLSEYLDNKKCTKFLDKLEYDIAKAYTLANKVEEIKKIIKS